MLMKRHLATAFACLVASSALMTPVQALAQTVVIGSEGAIPPLDPHRMTGTQGLRVIDAIYDPLVREDLSEVTDTAPALKASLAEKWTVSDDGLIYHFTLRSGVKFHDGTDFDANAVQANFARVMDKASDAYDERAAGNMTFLTRWIEKTAAIDAGTFEITLKEPFAGLLRLLSDRRSGIISPANISAHKGDGIGLNPVGTGPFTLKAFQQGQQLELKRNDAYWGGAAGVESLIFRPVTDPTAMAIAMQTGQVDIIPSASSQQIAQLSVDPSLQIQYPEPANQYFVRLNTKAQYTDNKLFRQALNYAVNRDNLAALLNGQVTPLGGPVPSGNELPGNSGMSYTYDPTKAKELLAQAGISTGVTIRLLAPNSGPGFGQASEIITLLQQDLGEVGINLEPQFLEFATLVSTEGPGYKDDIQGSFNGWTTGADSAYWLERMFAGDQQPPRGVNRGWFSNAQADQVFARARGESDETKRLDLYRQAAERLADDSPWIFLYQDRLPRVLSARVSGISPARSVFIDYPRIQVR
ncbi:ABC transporter substrate-binding protein [Ensifer sp. Root127]|uniref:ABC transporter substrate-binding protein n=1 Tax=Ensifer sp. Root127 TaxID=1736440 RepID=UPI000A5C0864|nr:ABC transporter substrate-binding protein [Ensifer sp. Root127]